MMQCIYCDKEIATFLCFYKVRNDKEEKELYELRNYLKNLGKLPPWPIVDRCSSEDDC